MVCNGYRRGYVSFAYFLLYLKISGQLVKMLITLDSRRIIGSNFVYLCILTVSSHWYAKR